VLPTTFGIPPTDDIYNATRKQNFGAFCRHLGQEY
jgi:hypothetical protein